MTRSRPECASINYDCVGEKKLDSDDDDHHHIYDHNYHKSESEEMGFAGN